MGHWRDGGIGNMAGSDDRPIEEWTLLEKLAEIATTNAGAAMPRCLGHSTNWGVPLSAIAQDAFDEIQRLHDEVARLVAAVIEPDWLPIDTAPVEPGHVVPIYYRFRCLLQDAQGDVFEGAGYYVKVGRATSHLTLRWQNVKERQVFPRFWKPLPWPKKTENGGAA